MQFPYSYWAGFSPTDISSLLFWYRPDMGVTLNAGRVQSILDQSNIPLAGGGQVKTLSSSTAGFRPIFNASGINSHPTMECTNAAKSGLTNETNAWSIPGGRTTTFTFFFVAKTTSLVGSQQVFGQADTGEPCRWAIGMGSGDSGWGVNSATTFPPIVAPLNTFVSRSYVKHAGTWDIYQNGTIQVVGVVDTTGCTNLSNIGIGGEDGGGGPYSLDGSIAEVIGYQAVLSTPDRIRIEEYLRSKYLLY